MKRPFFSVIIPCYNSRKVIGQMLDSLANQLLPKDKLEVVLADDCSTEPYEDVVEEYYDKLNIVWTKTAYNGYISNTRQVGVDKATGEWITFADHDDMFALGALKSVMAVIKAEDTKYYHTFVTTNTAHQITSQLAVFCGPSIITHGKFINKDNLWDAYNISYPKDLVCHEDLYLTELIEHCILPGELGGIPATLFDVYIWNNRSDSTGKKYLTKSANDVEFNNMIYSAYLATTGYVCCDYYRDHKVNREYLLGESLACACGAYYGIKRNEFTNPHCDYRYQEELFYKYCQYVIYTFECTETEFEQIANENYEGWFNSIVTDFYNYAPFTSKNKKGVADEFVRLYQLADFIYWMKLLIKTETEDYRDVQD